jgi:hypothetical protein
MPNAPAPLPAPGRPTGFEVALRPDGAIALSWACANPPGSQGTVYTIARRVGEGGPMTILGVVGAKSFVDAELPAGAARVTYQIQAVRSTRRGEPAMFLVQFGGAGGGVSLQSADRRAA